MEDKQCSDFFQDRAMLLLKQPWSMSQGQQNGRLTKKGYPPREEQPLIYDKSE